MNMNLIKKKEYEYDWAFDAAFRIYLIADSKSITILTLTIPIFQLIYLVIWLDLIVNIKTLRLEINSMFMSATYELNIEKIAANKNSAWLFL